MPLAPWRGAHLSTGASREAPVDNEIFSTIYEPHRAIRTACFSTILASLTTGNPGFAGLGTWADVSGLMYDRIVP